MPSYTRGAWLLSAETGVRISDALRAQASDFDAKRRFHYIAMKTGKRGTAQVSKKFYDTYVKGKSGNEWLFPSRKNPRKCVTRQTVFRHVKRACELLSLSSVGIAPHSARKNFAVDTFDRDGLGAVMQALQHSDVSTSLLYALSDNKIAALTDTVKRLARQVDYLNRVVEDLSDRVFGDDVYSP